MFLIKKNFFNQVVLNQKLDLNKLLKEKKRPIKVYSFMIALNTQKVSVISPVYKAETIIHELVKRIEENLQNLVADYEIILIEDSSPDNSWKVIEQVFKINSKVKGVQLSKNFGQHNAISCGLDLADGDLVIVMDCDLQHDPTEFKRFFEKMVKDDSDLVFGIHKERKHSFLKNITAQIYYVIYNALSEIPSYSFKGELSGFVLMKRNVVDELVKIREKGSHFLLNLRIVGFNYSTLEIKHLERYEGESSYTLMRLIKHAVDGITAHSTKLLRLSIYMGLFMSLLSLVFAGITIYKYLFAKILPGFTSLITIIVFLAGATMVMLGIIGLYLGKVFDQVKNRPLYHISKILKK